MSAACQVTARNDEVSCDVICKDGLPFTWTVPAGIVAGQGATLALAKANANFLAGALACERARTGKICFLTNGLPNGKIGEAYNQTVRAMGGVPWQFPFLPIGCGGFNAVPYDFQIEFFGPGFLPDGLTLGCLQGGAPGQIMGTPTTAGTFPFVIVATDAVGAFQRKQFSITIEGPSFGNITPPITSNAGTAWPGSIAAGTYKVSYVKGALRYGNNALWLLNLDNGFAHRGYRIVHSGGTIVEFPGTNDAYGSQALVEAANAGRQISINHTGGTIRMYLDDSDYSDNGAGMPNPTFRLSA